MMQCPICFSSSHNDPESMLIHIKFIHSRESTYPCIYAKCFRKFGSISKLKSHVSKCVDASGCVLGKKIAPEKEKKTTLSFLSPTMTNEVCPAVASTSAASVVTNNIEESILEFACKLYSNNSIPRSLVQEVYENSTELLQKMTTVFGEALKSALPLEFHAIVEKSLTVPEFAELNTEYKRMQHLEKKKLFVQPESFFIGEINDDRRIDGNTVFTKKECNGQIISLRKILKIYLELPNVFGTITTYINEELSHESGFYTSLFQGTVWKNIQTHFQGKIVVPLYLYYDDFEVGDPLSPAAGIHKIGGLYFSIAAMPPKYSAKLENLFLAQLIYTSDQKNCRNEACFRKIIEELKFLSNTGISISVADQTYTVYFVVIALLGDNLGVNSLFGFCESFSGHYFCRFCRAQKTVTQSQCLEIESLMRDVHNYDCDLESLSCGVKERCAFNDLPFFHNTVNSTCDIMHDLYLGVCRYDIARILGYFVKEGYFTLQYFNERLKYFDYSEFDRGNKISSISENHIRNGCVITTAAEMSALIAYLGIMIGDLVPEDDPVWELYLTLYEIIDLVTSSISEEQILYLEQLIKSHNEQYIQLFNETLKPKFHFLVHYPNVIRRMGPLKSTSCTRFEAFHKQSKMYARVVSSRRNIIYSVAMKLQLQLTDRFLCQRGIADSVDCGHIIRELSRNFEYDRSLTFDSPSFELTWIRVNGITYKPKCSLHLTNNDQNDPVLGIIVHVITTESKEIFFVYKECITIGFNNHMKGYEIALPSDEAPHKLLRFNNDRFLRPIKIHVSADARNIVSRRDLE